MGILNKQSCFLFLLSGLGPIFAAPGSETHQIDYWRHDKDEDLIPVDPYDIQPPLKSSYLIIQREKGANPEDWNVFYYIPRDFVKADVIRTATVAAATDYKLHPKNRVRRELQGYESPAFRNLVPDFQKFSNDTDSIIDRPETINWQAHKVFLFTAKTDGRVLMTEVPIDLEYIIGNHMTSHCLVCALDKIYLYCEESSSEKQKYGAEKLAEILSKRREKTSSDMVIVAAPRERASRSRIPYSKFIETLNNAFEASSNSRIFRSRSPSSRSGFTDETRHHGFTLREMRQILNQSTLLMTRMNGTEENFNLIINNLGEKGQYLGNVETHFHNLKNCFYIRDMEATQCYVIDSQSNLGILVWMGKNAKIEIREAAAKRAEYRAMWNEYGRPIIFVDQEEVTQELLGVSHEVSKTSINYLVAKILGQVDTITVEEEQ